MSTQLDADQRRNLILNAALVVFARYGFKRVAMADISEEAGLSRPVMYLAFPNKSAIFEALAVAMGDKVCADARMAWRDDISFSDGLTQAAIALSLDAWRLLKGSPHGGELVSSNSATVAGIAATVDTRFGALVEEKLRAIGHGAFDAKIIVSAVAGIKDKATSEEELVTRVANFARVLAVGLGAD